MYTLVKCSVALALYPAIVSAEPASEIPIQQHLIVVDQAVARSSCSASFLGTVVPTIMTAAMATETGTAGVAFQERTTGFRDMLRAMPLGADTLVITATVPEPLNTEHGRLYIIFQCPSPAAASAVLKFHDDAASKEVSTFALDVAFYPTSVGTGRAAILFPEGIAIIDYPGAMPHPGYPSHTLVSVDNSAHGIWMSALDTIFVQTPGGVKRVRQIGGEWVVSMQFEDFVAEGQVIDRALGKQYLIGEGELKFIGSYDGPGVPATLLELPPAVLAARQAKILQLWSIDSVPAAIEGATEPLSIPLPPLAPTQPAGSPPAATQPAGPP